jgi:cell division protein FtsZ
VPPAPQLTPEQAEQLLTVQQNPKHSRKKGSPMRQGQLPLEIVSKGRFEKSEPTIHQGEDLDVPTYIRRGVALN